MRHQRPAVGKKKNTSALQIHRAASHHERAKEGRRRDNKAGTLKPRTAKDGRRKNICNSLSCFNLLLYAAKIHKMYKVVRTTPAPHRYGYTKKNKGKKARHKEKVNAVTIHATQPD
uniref:Uncharacterized protein n=1 Tax=Trypanosoma congolense (strain IL3000) TaxID=1068625 RepID=G0UQC6_TRYCI|nr:hypothetical protein, unlikely [Trypanosoma congolense IL3000]